MADGCFPTLPRPGPGRQRPPYPSRRLTPPLVALTPPTPSGPACTVVRGGLAWRMAPVPLPEPICLICSKPLRSGTRVLYEHGELFHLACRSYSATLKAVEQVDRAITAQRVAARLVEETTGCRAARQQDAPNEPGLARVTNRFAACSRRRPIGAHRELGSRLPKEEAVQEGTKCRRRSIDADRFTRTWRAR
jgi:hypothetical protein